MIYNNESYMTGVASIGLLQIINYIWLLIGFVRYYYML